MGTPRLSCVKQPVLYSTIMVEVSSSGRDSTDLCTNCGLCCNGVLFDNVPVEADEQPRLEELGFAIHEEESKQVFAQPCPMFDGRCCTVYEQRPTVCAQFRCKLLRNVQEGKVPFDDALGFVFEAKSLLEQLSGLRQPADESVGSHWSTLFRKWQSKAPSDRTDPA